MATELKCLHDGGIAVRVRVSGYWDQSVMLDGEIDYTNTDDMIHTQPKTGICQSCNRRVPNPNYKRQ